MFTVAKEKRWIAKSGMEEWAVFPSFQPSILPSAIACRGQFRLLLFFREGCPDIVASLNKYG